MPHYLKNQPASTYKPKLTRRPSRLSPIREFNAKKMWNSLVRMMKKKPKYEKRGRFNVFTI